MVFWLFDVPKPVLIISSPYFSMSCWLSKLSQAVASCNPHWVLFGAIRHGTHPTLSNQFWVPVDISTTYGSSRTAWSRPQTRAV